MYCAIRECRREYGLHELIQKRQASISRRGASMLYTVKLLTRGLMEIANAIVNSPGMVLINDAHDGVSQMTSVAIFKKQKKTFGWSRVQLVDFFVRNTSDRKNFLARSRRGGARKLRVLSRSCQGN